MSNIDGKNMSGKKWDDYVIFIGNGLGRALDNNHFSLKNTIKKEMDSIKKEEFYDFFKTLLDYNSDSFSEDKLQNAHIFFDSIHNIENLKIEEETRNKISNDLFTFKEHYNCFVRNITQHFFEYDPQTSPQKSSFDRFIKILRDSIFDLYDNQIRTNIVTTNYDQLLYSAFLSGEKQVFGGNYEKSKLIDGFFKKNRSGHPIFERMNFRNHKSKCGFYLHLHGSPLFYEDDQGNICKFTRPDLIYSPLDKKDSGKKISIDHIVLCHSHQKETHIVSSRLLNHFFEEFMYRVRRAKKIIIFGYGGCDDHINSIFSKALKSSSVYIIDRNGENGENGKSFWEKLLVNHNDHDDEQKELPLFYASFDSILKDDSLNHLEKILKNKL